MKINKQYLYTVKQSAEYLGVTTRYLQMLAKKQAKVKIDGRYLYSGHELLDMASKRTEKRSEVERIKKVDKRIAKLVDDIKNDDAVTEILTAFSQGFKLEKFSEEEYQTFVTRLTEANFLEKRIIEYKEEIQRMEDYVKDYRTNIEYLKGSLEKQQLQMNKVLTQISERNVIEAKEKDVLR